MVNSFIIHIRNIHLCSICKINYLMKHHPTNCLLMVLHNIWLLLLECLIPMKTINIP